MKTFHMLYLKTSVVSTMQPKYYITIKWIQLRKLTLNTKNDSARILSLNTTGNLWNTVLTLNGCRENFSVSTNINANDDTYDKHGHDNVVQKMAK